MRLQPDATNVLPCSFYLEDTVSVARGLLGAYLVKHTGNTGRGLYIGKIVETEAYHQDDPASHSYKGPTPRSAPMFEEGGISYVYLIYGMYNCLNVVTEARGMGGAVLIRAVEPVEGIEQMWRNRFGNKPFRRDHIYRLCNGPGKLCRAFDIHYQRDNRKSLINSDITITEAASSDTPFSIVEAGRIGISSGAETPYRFYIDGNQCVSDFKQKRRQSKE
jgi:DNA-3-methyladenine glycosylase